MTSWAPPPPVLVKPAKIVGYRVIIKKKAMMLVRDPVPWVAVQSLFPTLEGARSHLRKLIADHSMICEKAEVESGYDIAIQAVKEDGKFENVEMICMTIDMGGQSI